MCQIGVKHQVGPGSLQPDLAGSHSSLTLCTSQSMATFNGARGVSWCAVMAVDILSLTTGAHADLIE